MLPRLALLGALLIAASAIARSQSKVEISWGSAIGEQKMILSDGTSLDPDNLIIEIGTFDGNFLPAAGNLTEWLAHWRVFDAITDTDPGIPTTDPDPGTTMSPNPDYYTNVSGGDETARYAGMAHLLDDQTSDSEDAAAHNLGYDFGPNDQAYVFIRTSDIFGTGSQWLLFTSAVDSDGAGLVDSVWQFPEVQGGQPEISLEWFLAQADTAVFGAIDGGSGNGGSTGGGDFTDSSTDFALRLHTVPEPRTWFYALIPAAILLLRRRC